MTRRELIEQLADRLRIPDHSAQVFLHAFFDAVKSILRAGESVTIEHLGAWSPLLNADGSLQEVTFAALEPAYAEEEISGPVSSIDTRHFIPAEALNYGITVNRDPVDVADLVAEVQRMFVQESISEPNDYAVEENADDRYAEDAPIEEEYPEEETVTEDYPEEESVTKEYSEEESVTEEYPEEESVPGEYDEEEWADDGYSENELTAEEYADEDPAPEVSLEEAPVAEETEHLEGEEELEDNAVFYRNRDQLYNPPDERSDRRLLYVALGLTLIVLVIILFILFGEDEKPSFDSGGLPTPPAAAQIGPFAAVSPGPASTQYIRMI